MPVLDPGDAVIDGGNSYYRDDIERPKTWPQAMPLMSDCRDQRRGVGRRSGLLPRHDRRRDPGCRAARPAFSKPHRAGNGNAEPTRRTRSGGAAPSGYLHCAAPTVQPFVNMVHDGVVESGMMSAIAEGLSIIEHANAGQVSQVVDAETTPCATLRPTRTTSTSARSPNFGGGFRSTASWLG